MTDPFHARRRHDVEASARLRRQRALVKNDVRQEQDRIEPVQGLTWRSVVRFILITAFLTAVGIFLARFGRL